MFFIQSANISKSSSQARLIFDGALVYANNLMLSLLVVANIRIFSDKTCLTLCKNVFSL